MRLIGGWLCIGLALAIFFLSTYEIGTRLGLTVVLLIAGFFLFALTGFLEGLSGRSKRGS